MLILAATPIGNIADASQRLISTLESAQYVACEDTRVFRQLCTALKIHTDAKVFSLHEHNERDKLAGLVKLAAEHDVVVVSDAGMPTISDPGYLLVSAAASQDIPITVIPGPSAVVSALAVSGLPTDSFSFLGFMPRKSSERQSLLSKHASAKQTLIFFESPHRIAEALADCAQVLGDRKGAVARELTKKFEEVVRGSLADLVSWAEKPTRGELVVVIQGAGEKEQDYGNLAERALQLAAKGLSLKEAAGFVAELTGASKNEIYEHALKRKA